MTEREDRLKNEAASRRTQDIIGATPSTLTEQINHSPCQRCTGSCQVIFFKAETSDCPCVTVRLTVRLTHGCCGLLFQQKKKKNNPGCLHNFLPFIQERTEKSDFGRLLLIIFQVPVCFYLLIVQLEIEYRRKPVYLSV